jgi:rhodanese-related sulfurtransferase
MTDEIRTITAEELKAKLDRGERLRLVNALGDWEFRAKRIPTSEHFESTEAALGSLKPDEEIVVYCSNPACRASQELYKALVQRGYEHVRRFSGGLLAWEDAGYTLEGEGI